MSVQILAYDSYAEAGRALAAGALVVVRRVPFDAFCDSVHGAITTAAPYAYRVAYLRDGPLFAYPSVWYEVAAARPVIEKTPILLLSVRERATGRRFRLELHAPGAPERRIRQFMYRAAGPTAYDDCGRLPFVFMADLAGHSEFVFPADSASPRRSAAE